MSIILRCVPESAVGVVSSMRQVFEFEGHYPGLPLRNSFPSSRRLTKAARVVSSLRLACVPAQHDSRKQSQKSLLMARDGRAAAAAASLREIKLTLRYGLPIPVGLWALAECFLLHRIFSVIGVNRE